MAFVPTPNCVRIVISFAFGEQDFSNVFHATKSNFVEADMAALAEDIDAAVDASHMPNISNTISYVKTTVYDIRTADGPLVVDATNSGLGAAADTTVPINNALVITLRTNTRGRTGRGRVYVTGFGDAELTNNSFSVNAQDAAVDYIMAVRAAMTGNGWTHVIRSTQVDGTPLNPAITRPVIAFDCRSRVVGSQRRRIDRP